MQNISTPKSREGRSSGSSSSGLLCLFERNWLTHPETVEALANRAATSESTVRRWLKTLDKNDLAVGYTRPRRYWLRSEENSYNAANHIGEMATIASRNRM